MRPDARPNARPNARPAPHRPPPPVPAFVGSRPPMTEPSMAKRWRATTLPYLALRGGGQAAEFVGWVILARRLGTEAFGELAVAALACRYAGLVADWGA